MKNRICTIVLSTCFLAAALNLQAQNYKTAIGARLGYPLSASIKHFVSETSALEGYIGTRGYSGYRWTNVSGAYLYHRPIEEVEGLNWYVGGGASIYFWSFDFGFGEDYGNKSFGVQGYGGLEYNFEDVPLNISIDWVPTIFFNSYLSGFGYGYGSVAVRYMLKR